MSFDFVVTFVFDDSYFVYDFILIFKHCLLKHLSLILILIYMQLY